MQQPGKVALIVDDMFFAAKIRGAAEAAGRQIERIKSREQLEQDSAASPPALFIIDLNADRVDPVGSIQFIKAAPELKHIPVVSFVSHVQADLIARAKQAGCDYVLPRSRFTQVLPQIIAGDLSPLRLF